MHLANGSLERAAQFATVAIGAAPQLPEAWALEGDVLRAREDYPAALARYHRALSYRANFPAVQLAVSEIYMRQNRHGRALATLASLGEQYDGEAAPQQLYALRAECLRSLGRLPEAADQFELAARLAPATPDLLYALADCRWRCGEAEAARAAAEQALALAPAHEEAQRLLAQLDGHERY
jgi:tetratricopeptide (TPR) repeat protein